MADEILHSTTLVGSDDPDSEVSVSAWNDSHQIDAAALTALLQPELDTDALATELAGALVTEMGAIVSEPAGDQTITSQNAGDTPLAVQAHASQSDNLQTWKDSSGNLLARVTNVGHIRISSLFSAASLVVGTTQSNDSAGGYVAFQKTRGTTHGSTTTVQSGDEIGGLLFQAADGTTYRNAAAIKAFVDGTPGSSDMPGSIRIYTTADGASSLTERLRVTQDGRIILGAGGTGPQILFGSGSPEAVVTAPVGSLYLRTDGPNPDGTIIYQKYTGTGNTGWGSVH